MLRFLSKQQRARNAFLIFFCLVMVITLVIFLGMPIGDWISQAVKTNTKADATAVVAEVDGEDITLGELQKVLDRMNQMSQGGRGFGFMSSFSDEMLDQLIEQRLKDKEARRLGLTVTDDEVRQQIARLYPTFVENNRRFVSFDLYRRAIERSGSTVEEFERSLRQSLLDQKLQTFITAGVTVTPREVEEDYVRQNTSVNLVYVVLEPKNFEAQVDVTEAEAREYFEKHREDFKIKEQERKVDYVFVSYKALERQVRVTDEELKQEYERTKTQHTVGATVSQLVFPFNETNEAEVRQRADEAVKKARGDEKTPAEDFAKLGGKSIGYVKKDAQDTSYKQRVFLLSESQKDVTDPIREKDAFYVLKVTSWKRKSLAEVRPELLNQIRERKARSEASTLAAEIKKRVDETKNLRQVAGEFRARLGNLPLDQIIRHTGFFATADQLPEFDTYASSFVNGTAQLKEKGQVGNQIYLKDGLAIPQLVDTRQPHDPRFEEVKDRVLARLRQQKARDRARQRAEQIARQTATVADLEKVAKSEKLELKKQEDFKRGSLLTDLERSDQLEGFAFHTSVGRVAQHAIKVGEKFVILGVTKRQAADLTKLAQEQDDIRKRLLDQRRVQLYQAYLDALKERWAAQGRIVIYEDVLKSISGGEEGDLRDLFNITPAQP